MSSKIYTLRADKQHPLKDVCAKLKSEMDKKLGADLCADICRTENDSQIRMLAFECFYLHMGGFASLGILLIENSREQTDDVVTASFGAPTRIFPKKQCRSWVSWALPCCRKKNA